MLPEKTRIHITASLLLFVFVALSCKPPLQRADSDSSPAGDENAPVNKSADVQKLPQGIHLAFGNPSNASPDSSDSSNYLVVGEGSVFSYNDDRGTINWVSWKTTRSDLGEPLPRPPFKPDPRLPPGFKRIGYFDYSGSGYDRGHMVPSADRFGNPMQNEETFMMTNIVPQTGALNQHPWQKLESYIRSQVRRGFDVYQIAGVYGDRERLKGKVVVPTNCWKIAAFLPRGHSPGRIGARTRIIAVDMPNVEGIEEETWRKFKTTIRSIEERTGLDFFADKPPDLQERLEKQIDLGTRIR